MEMGSVWGGPRSGARGRTAAGEQAGVPVTAGHVPLPRGLPGPCPPSVWRGSPAAAQGGGRTLSLSGLQLMTQAHPAAARARIADGGPPARSARPPACSRKLPTQAPRAVPGAPAPAPARHLPRPRSSEADRPWGPACTRVSKPGGGPSAVSCPSAWTWPVRGGAGAPAGRGRGPYLSEDAVQLLAGAQVRQQQAGGLCGLGRGTAWAGGSLVGETPPRPLHPHLQGWGRGETTDGGAWGRSCPPRRAGHCTRAQPTPRPPPHAGPRPGPGTRSALPHSWVRAEDAGTPGTAGRGPPAPTEVGACRWAGRQRARPHAHLLRHRLMTLLIMPPERYCLAICGCAATRFRTV